MGTLQHRIADDSTIIGMHSVALFGETYILWGDANSVASLTRYKMNKRSSG